MGNLQPGHSHSFGTMKQRTSFRRSQKKRKQSQNEDWLRDTTEGASSPTDGVADDAFGRRQHDDDATNEELEAEVDPPRPSRKGGRSFRLGKDRHVAEKIDRFRRTMSLRKRKDGSDSSKSHQWEQDEIQVKQGTSSYEVKYLGCIEVFESRGMPVCEDAVKSLKARCKQNGTKPVRAILHVSGDGLRVVDLESKGLLVDQTIEKVSFCAPDRNHDRGFAYICRDGTTRRWLCHGFLSVAESGERLSHAVGCAFALCLERKIKRDKECEVTVSFDENKTAFARTGSFRQMTLTEKMADPQSAVITEAVPERRPGPDLQFAMPRPQTSAEMFERQGSFRGFPTLNQTVSPFKRQLSLRVNELPSNVQRRNQRSNTINAPSTIPENEVPSFANDYAQQNGSIHTSTTYPGSLTTAQVETSPVIADFDPFNVRWANIPKPSEPATLNVTDVKRDSSLQIQQKCNPFKPDVVAKTFEVKL